MAVYQDGNYPSGAPVVVINNVNYVANSFTVDKSANVVQINNQNGEQVGALSMYGAKTGTAELQFAASTTAEPTTAAENSTRGVFVANVDGANVNCFITSCTVNKPANSNWTASVAFQVRRN
jgi:hypothetical protein